MKLVLRFAIPVIVLMLVLGNITAYLVDYLTTAWFTRDLQVRSRLVEFTLHDLIVDLEETKTSQLEKIFQRILQDERVHALALCPGGRPDSALSLRSNGSIYNTEKFPEQIQCANMDLNENETDYFLKTEVQNFYVSIIPVIEGGLLKARLIVVHNADFLHTRSNTTQISVTLLFVFLFLTLSFMAFLIAKSSWRNFLREFRQVLQKPQAAIQALRSPALRPIARDLRVLARDLERIQFSRDEFRVQWSPELLKQILNRELMDEEIIAVSNREPYIHEKKDGEVKVSFPASGLVTAIEPIMRACSGVWVAHGSGSADREFVDSRDKLWVPPGKNHYQLKRVWLTPEQEQGYYYGFSNEGLWPLCHIAHVRPVFRDRDWQAYKDVNALFAERILAEVKTKSPVILVQDYHFALLPGLLRKLIPDAVIITFWHIPWPNPESFGICPWRDEILEGLLGSSILGFHTRYHCNNFLDTVDRYLESRIDHDEFLVQHHGHVCAVNPYPISIDTTWIGQKVSLGKEREEIRNRHGLSLDMKIAIGVDRLDYTKGILERIRSFESLLETHPEWRGKVVLIQIGAPSRSGIDTYQFFQKQVQDLVNEVNRRFSTGNYNPVILLAKHHNPDEVQKYLKAADVCVVSSLHDGMNLVAKEFVSCRSDLQGVLILSQFTGAARELAEALIINPYYIRQFSEALHIAFSMPPEEQSQRMEIMRKVVGEFNIFRWAGRMLLDAVKIKQRRHFWN